MLKRILAKLENPQQPFLGPNVKALKFWGLLLPKKLLPRCFYYFMHFYPTVFAFSEYIDVWYLRSDLNLLLNNVKITMLATMCVLKMLIFIYWQQDWKDIIDYVTRADLAQRATADPIKNRLIQTFTAYNRKITYSYWFLVLITCVCGILNPIVKYCFFRTYRDNVRNRTVPYVEVASSWVPFDKTTIPGYLGASLFQSCSSIYGCGWITCYDANAVAIMIFFRVELELLRIDTANMFGTEESPVSDEVATNRFKDFYRRHVELCRVASLYDSMQSPIMMLYTFVCSVMLCVTAYQINTVTDTVQLIISVEYLMFGVAQLFIFCWHSNDVLYSSQDLRCGPFESSWYANDVKHRKNLLMLTGQYTRTIVFSAGPFSKLTLATFVNILKGTYSYYTLLSKSDT